ncbi:serine hydrolase [Asanoa sp. NPDC050611]|uniref:serine hydrolase n=1 Tax=Asanoa sp. NPDC050611 TaxID=3157098 RepID=UPI00340062F4
MSASHRRRRTRRANTVTAVAVVLATVGLAGTLLWAASPLVFRSPARARPQIGAAGRVAEPAVAGPAGRAAPTPSPLPVKATEIRIPHSGWFSWALLDTRTGEMFGPSDRTAVSTTASLIKSWIGADFLRRAAEQGQTPSEEDLEQVESMIRDSDNDAADALHEANGGPRSISRLISHCGLQDSRVAADGGWSRTLLSPADITRLGACIADGRAAGPVWTTYLLDELRAVRDEGDFGIRKAFPPDQQHTIATKNGWVEREEELEYHVSCMAIGAGWVVGVMTRYEIDKGVEYGAAICERVGAKLREAAGR